MKRTIKAVHGHKNIDGLIPGIKGQRAFPTLNFRNTDPFVMLDHIGPEKVGADYFLDGQGHDHPHRGFETLTFMFEGEMHHRDSLGNRVELNSGGVQRMNAGSGIIHGGDMASDKGTHRFHEMQLWVNNPKEEKMSTPNIHNVSAKDIPQLNNGHHKLKVVTGLLNGLKGSITTKANTQIAHLISDGIGNTTIENLTADNNVFVYMLEGEATVDGQLISPYSLVEFNNDGSTIEVETKASAQLLILSGEPLNEPVVYGGPFVMNTTEEIETANRDFNEGKFGSIEY